MNLVRPQRARAMLGALLLAYLATRLVRLASFPPFFDEGYYAAQANTAYLDPNQAFIALADGKGPLQTWLAMGVLALHVHPLVAVRIVSLLAGAVTLAAVVGIAGRIAGAPAALCAGVVYVVLPFALVHDPMGLVDPITTACMATALYCQVRLAQQPGIAWGLAAGVATGLGLLTKANALFALAALPLSLLLLDWSADGRGTRVRRWCAGAGTAAVVALAIQSVMRLSGLYAGMGKVSSQIGAYHSVGEGVAHAWKYIRQNDGFGAALTGYLTIPLILGGLAGIVWLARSGRSRSALVLFAWFAGPVAIGWLLATNAYPRYILSAVPAFAVLAGTGAAWLLAEAHRHRGALLMAGAAVALTALALARDVTVLAHPATSGYVGADVRQYVTEWPSGNDYTRVAHELEALAGPGKVVVATTSLPPFSLAALLGRPHLIKGTGVAPVAWAVEARHGRTNFRLSPESDPQIRRARLAVFDQSLTRFVPPEVLHGRVVFSQTRPRSGTTIVVVRPRGGTGAPLSVP